MHGGLERLRTNGQLAEGSLGLRHSTELHRHLKSRPREAKSNLGSLRPAQEDLAEKGPHEEGPAPRALVGPHGWLLRGDSSRSGLYFWFLEPKEVLPRGHVLIQLPVD